MGGSSSFTDYGEFFLNQPVGAVVGGSLFAIALVALVVSSIVQVFVKRCCPKEKETNPIEEGRVEEISEDHRRSFENPVYTNEVKETGNIHKNNTQNEKPLENQISVEHDYVNANKYKKPDSDSEPEIDYENLKEKPLKPPTRKHIEQTENAHQQRDEKDKTTKRRNQKLKNVSFKDQENIPTDNYDRPKPTSARNSSSDDEIPDYDVPKSFPRDSDELPDYDVPKSFTG